MSQRLRLKALSVGTIAVATLASSQAATISWGTAFNIIGTPNPADIFYQGAYSSIYPTVAIADRSVVGYNTQNFTGTINSLTGDDIAFAFNSFPNIASGFDGGTPGTTDATLNLILEDMTWPGNRGANNPTPITTQIPNLVVGELYEIQLIAGDNRNATTSNRTITFADTSGNTTPSLRLGDFPTVYGTFIADATTQDIVIQGNAHPYLSAVVVYTVPEPTRGVLLFLGLLGLVLRRQR